MKDVGLLILRTGSGAMMMFGHGLPKFLKLFSPEKISFADPIGLGAGISFSLAMFAEFFCSMFLILGLFPRLSLIPLIIAMSVAGFIYHLPDPFASKEKAFIYLIIFISLLILGAGKYSLNKLLPAKFNKY